MLQKSLFFFSSSAVSLRPHGLQPSRLLCPWDFPGRNTGVGYHSLLQGIFPTQGLNLGFPRLLHWQAGSLPLCHLGRPPLVGMSLSKTTWAPPEPALVIHIHTAISPGSNTEQGPRGVRYPAHQARGPATALAQRSCPVCFSMQP